MELAVILQNPDAVESMSVPDLAEIFLSHIKRTQVHAITLARLCNLEGGPIQVATWGRTCGEIGNRPKERPFRDRLTELRQKIVYPLGESWQFLCQRGMLAPEPTSVALEYFVTRLGMSVTDHESFLEAIGQKPADESAKGKKRFGRAKA